MLGMLRAGLVYVCVCVGGGRVCVWGGGGRAWSEREQ